MTRSLCCAVLALAACNPPRGRDIVTSDPPDGPPVTAAQPFADAFDRPQLGADWWETGGHYKIVDGALSVRGGKNHPLWLRHKLPGDFAVDLETWSNSRDGDIKVELCGDGRSFDPDEGAYKATGYVVIFGGWKNTKSIIARQDEHGREVAVDPTGLKVEPGRHYRFHIERRGNVIDWSIDGQPFLRYQDPRPLTGRGHEYFAVSNWEADVYFDNLRISAL